jgi:hypothetical protein
MVAERLSRIVRNEQLSSVCLLSATSLIDDISITRLRQSQIGDQTLTVIDFLRQISTRRAHAIRAQDISNITISPRD